MNITHFLFSNFLNLTRIQEIVHVLFNVTIYAVCSVLSIVKFVNTLSDICIVC